MTKLAFLACVIATLLPLAVHATLVQTIFISRHGNRNPIIHLPNDRTGDHVAALTVQGMANAYKLGRRLRDRYIATTSFLSPRYMAEDIYVRSSDSDRCIETAHSILAGLYDRVPDPAAHGPLEEEHAEDARVTNYFLRAPPVPVHTVPSHRDNLLKGHKHCPAFAAAWNAIAASDTFVDGPDDDARPPEGWPSFLDELRRVAGLENRSTDNLLRELDDIADPFLVLEEASRLRDSGLAVSSDFLRRLRHLADWQWHQKFSGEHCAKFCSSALMYDVFAQLRRAARTVQKVEQGEDPSSSVFPRMVMYVGHDVPLMGLFAALDPQFGAGDSQDTTHILPFLANLVVELHTITHANKEDFELRFFYNLDHEFTVGRNLCGPGNNCRSMQTLETVLMEHKFLLDANDWATECNIRDPPQQSEFDGTLPQARTVSLTYLRPSSGTAEVAFGGRFLFVFGLLLVVAGCVRLKPRKSKV